MRYIKTVLTVSIISCGVWAQENGQYDPLSELDKVNTDTFRAKVSQPMEMPNGVSLNDKAINGDITHQVESNPQAKAYLRQMQQYGVSRKGESDREGTQRLRDDINTATKSTNMQVYAQSGNDDVLRMKQQVNTKTGVTNKGYNNAAVETSEVSEERVQQYKKQMQQQGVTELFSDERLAKKTRQYENAAKVLADKSQMKMANALQQYEGLSQRQALSFSGQVAPGEEASPSVRNVVFFSFSMREAEILEAMKAAVRDGSTMVLNGIASHHTGIHDTIRELQYIGRDLSIKPDVRFKPKLFEKYNVTKVPTILYEKDGVAVSAEGILNVGWLKSKHKEVSEDKFYGNYGAVYAVEEESLLETIRSRMANYDWTGKREKAITGYWKKQNFNTLPPATESQTWYIDPTVRVQKDIKNPNGDYLARAGQVINPLASSPTPLTFYVFDPTDTTQLSWMHNTINTDANNGQVMLMFSRLNKEKGWDHLSALREHFSRELYQLPKELINKFDLKALPVKVTADLNRKVFKVEQFEVQQ